MIFLNAIDTKPIFYSNWDGSVVYAKNSVLATQYIINARRTGPTGETFGKSRKQKLNRLYLVYLQRDL